MDDSMFKMKQDILAINWTYNKSFYGLGLVYGLLAYKIIVRPTMHKSLFREKMQ